MKNRLFWKSAAAGWLQLKEKRLLATNANLPRHLVSTPFIKLERSFLFLSMVILASAGVLKVLSALGNERLMDSENPIFFLSNRLVFGATGLTELILVLYLLLGTNRLTKLFLLAWLGTIFCIYRIGLSWLGAGQPCGCMGSMLKSLRRFTEYEQVLANLFVGFLVLGSYAFLAWRWIHGKEIEAAVSQRSVETGAPIRERD